MWSEIKWIQYNAMKAFLWVFLVQAKKGYMLGSLNLQ